MLLAATLTGYMLIAVVFEERDLIAHFGRVYEDYRSRVPMFVPRFRSCDTQRGADPETESKPRFQSAGNSAAMSPQNRRTA